MEELSGAGPASGPVQAAPGPEARSRSRRARVKRLLRWYAVVSRALHRTLLSVLAHDFLNVAESTAYSAIVALFPALIVAAAVIGLLPETAPVRFSLRISSTGAAGRGECAAGCGVRERAEAHPLGRALVSAGGELCGRVKCDCDANGRAAAGTRAAAQLLELLATAKAVDRTGSVVAGSTNHREPAGGLRPRGVGLAVGKHRAGGARADLRGDRAAALGAGGGRKRWADRAAVSHGSAEGARGGRRARRRTGGGLAGAAQEWWWTSLPGAVLATALWFPATLVFGWYVTRFTNYSEVYGPLGAGIALLFWLYIISLSDSPGRSSTCTSTRRWRRTSAATGNTARAEALKPCPSDNLRSPGNSTIGGWDASAYSPTRWPTRSLPARWWNGLRRW